MVQIHVVILDCFLPKLIWGIRKFLYQVVCQVGIEIFKNSCSSFGVKRYVPSFSQQIDEDGFCFEGSPKDFRDF